MKLRKPRNLSIELTQVKHLLFPMSEDSRISPRIAAAAAYVISLTSGPTDKLIRFCFYFCFSLTSLKTVVAALFIAPVWYLMGSNKQFNSYRRTLPPYMFNNVRGSDPVLKLWKFRSSKLLITSIILGLMVLMLGLYKQTQDLVVYMIQLRLSNEAQGSYSGVILGSNIFKVWVGRVL